MTAHTDRTRRSFVMDEGVAILVDARGVRWQDRAHFLGIAARLMRRVLVDHARARGSRKRGGAVRKVSLDEAMAVSPAHSRAGVT